MLRKIERLSILRTAFIFGTIIAISGGVFAQKNTLIPDIVLSEAIEEVTDSLTVAVAGEFDTHKVGFKTTISPLEDSSVIWITFPDGFDISEISGIVYSDNDDSNNGNPPVVRSWDNIDHTLKCYLSSGSQPAVSGSRISLEIFNVENSYAAGDYTVSLFVTDSLDNVTHGPGSSSPFTIFPDVLDHIVFVPGSDTSVAAGSSIYFNINGYDQYGNIITGLTFSYSVTVDSCGDFLNGVFTADKLGSCYVTASSGGIIDSSGLITVTPGPFNRFAITGTPAQRTAGMAFPNPVVVTVYDIRDNIKQDFAGNIWFASNDNQAVLPYRSGNPFDFPIDSAGVAAFAGGGFILKTSGSRVVSVTNGSSSASSNPITVQAAQIATFELSAGHDQTAGQSFILNVPFQTARDQFNNPASGNIIISAFEGGGSSPGGVPPVFTPINVIDGSGSANQTLTNAVPTVLQGSAAGVTAETDSILVGPGSINGFSIAGYPLSITAGETFPEDITITAYDPFGNIKTNYADTVYFESSDPQAILHPGHRFVPSDSGVHVFSGDLFSLRTAGEQTVSITNGSIFEISEFIDVNPAVIVGFSIAAPSFVSCGIPFVVTVSNARDQWNNLASGIVSVDDSTGGGYSPNGTSPVFNNIQVTNGSGIANQTLVNAVATVLKGTVNSVIRVTGEIDVRPGSLGDLELEISSPQYNDSVFSGTADLSAFDRYGNVKVDFDASIDTVVISSSAGGVMQNNILKLPGDFINGIADLISKQTSYSGRGGLMTFSALSQSGKVGISGPVEMRAIACENLTLVQPYVLREDTVTGSIEVVNDGSIVVEINQLAVFTEDGLDFDLISVNPGFPAPINAGQQQTFDISFDIPLGTPTGTYPFTAAAFGSFGGVPVSDTLDTFPDTLQVLSASNVIYVDGSLSRDTLSTGSWYALSLRLSNTGGAGIALFDSTNLTISDGTRQFRADISSGVFIPPDQPQGVTILMDPAYVDSAFDVGSYHPVLNLYGEENGGFVRDTIGLSDSITVQIGPELSYVQGSMTIDSLVQGQNASFAIRISNNGGASFLVDHQYSRITFGDSNREFVAYSDTSSAVRVDVILPGTDTLFSFTPTVLVPEFTPGNYLPTITLRGTHNGLSETRQFSTSPDFITVLTRGALRVDSTYAMSRNIPFVNTAQACSVKVVLSNLGLEPVQSFYATLENEGNLDSIPIPIIAGGGTATAMFSLNAGPDPDSGRIYTSSVTGGSGSVSEMPPQILQPVDNTAFIIVETPALLALSPISVVFPPGALDDTVAVNQIVTLSASVTNSGMANIEGAQRLTLDTVNSVFTVLDSANRDYSLDEDVFWEIQAPGNAVDSAMIIVEFLNRPIDSNDGEDAVGDDSLSYRIFTVNTVPTISQSPAISDPQGAVDGILSSGQSFVVTDNITISGIFENPAVSIDLPAGFSTEDQLTQTPTGGTVSWTVRAPDGPVTDSVAVEGWLFNPNTGDSIGTGADYIVIEVVERAILNLQTGIVGPGAALDGILEPGASLQYQAVVQNLGQASAGEGVMSLHLGNPDMQVIEALSRPFNPDIPVLWNITVPDSELLAPIPIWTSIDFLPFDENTDAPAFVLADSSGVNITVRELLPELVLVPVENYRGSVARGGQIDYMLFSITNRDRGGSFSVSIDSIGFLADFEPQDQITDIFSEMLLVSDTMSYASDLNSADTVRFNFENPPVLEPGQSLEFAFRLTVSAGAEIGNFSFSLNSDHIAGSVLEEGVPTIPLVGVSARGELEIIVGNPTVLLENDFLSSISIYPNPFNPREGPVRIDYNLDTDSDLELRIFTLVGEPVWSRSYSASDPLGSAGLHTYDSAIMWDGKNDSGHEVRSGVYICVFKNNSSGEEEKLKIAVVK